VEKLLQYLMLNPDMRDVHPSQRQSIIWQLLLMIIFTAMGNLLDTMLSTAAASNMLQIHSGINCSM
jgi:lipoprotein signal peptidase